MERREIEQRIIELVAEQFGRNATQITASTDLQDDLGADSMDVLGLIFEIEDAFCITIPDEPAEDMLTVSDIVGYVQKLVEDQ